MVVKEPGPVLTGWFRSIRPCIQPLEAAFPGVGTIATIISPWPWRLCASYDRVTALSNRCQDNNGAPPDSIHTDRGYSEPCHFPEVNAGARG